MKQYVDLIVETLKSGRIKTDRTGTGTISIFGHQSVYYMKDGFPLLTMKKTYPRGVFEELFWFLKGDTNIRYLNQKNVHIWDEWAYAKYKKYAGSLEESDYNVHVEDIPNSKLGVMTQEEFCKAIVDNEEFAKRWGDLGPIYGKQWVDWTAIDNSGIKPHTHGINQIQNIIDRLKNVPDCRRLIVNAWNVAELGEMTLNPCHTMFQFITEPLTFDERLKEFKEQGHSSYALYTTYGTKEGTLQKVLDEHQIPQFRLSLQLYQRSADLFLGVPFNIASYSLLLHMVAQVVNMVPHKFVHTFGDVHLYLNHKDQVNEFLSRTYKYEDNQLKFDYWQHKGQGTGSYYGPTLPKIKLNSEIKNIFDFTIDDIELIDYNPLPAIKAPVAV